MNGLESQQSHANKKDKILRFIIRGLHYRNYRLFFAGQGISLTGSWMQMIAVSWLIYRLTNSAFLLGVVAFTSQIPIFLLAPFAGALADRWNRRLILIITQILAMMQALTLAILTFTGVIREQHIITLSIFIGLVNAFDIPVRQAFVIDMVEDKKDLGNAIALNSFIFNGARLVGSSIAGIVIATVGEGMCFLLNSLSFFGVIVALLAMSLKEKRPKSEPKHVLKEIKEGFIYAFGFAPIRYMLFFTTLISLIGMSPLVIMPVFAKDILNGTSYTLGFLMAAAGLGAIMGTIYLASREDVRGLEKVISAATIIFGFNLVALSFSRVFWLSMLLLFFVGFTMMIQIVSSNTIIQHLTDDDKRGRVMSLHTIAFIGVAPFGSLLAGSLAGEIGAPGTFFVSGLLSILGALSFRAIARNLFLDPSLRSG